MQTQLDKFQNFVKIFIHPPAMEVIKARTVEGRTEWDGIFEGILTVDGYLEKIQLKSLSKY